MIPALLPHLSKHILLIQPHGGFSGVLVRHAPLGLLYAAAHVVADGFDVEIFDTRLFPGSWRTELRKRIRRDTLLVGISVMSGSPILQALAMTAAVKECSPSLPVVWGGPHTLWDPQHILRDAPACDYVVSGYAAEAFAALVRAIAEDQKDSLRATPGVSLRIGNGIWTSKPSGTFETLHHEKIPYHLIADYSVYRQLDQKRTIFSMYSAVGCPYQCSFCSSPAQYREIRGKKWVPYTADQIADHIQHVHERYGADYIYFIDDDSFVDLGHVRTVIGEIKRRRLPVGLGFRGARISEIKRMDDEFLAELADAGTDIMHIGAESGSDQVLKILRKNCTVQEILACNRKLARHPRITAAYNIMMGVPGESLEDLRKTRDLMLQLVADNPRCIIFAPNRFRPLPGTELFDIVARDHRYKLPRTLREWGRVEVEAEYALPWINDEMQRLSRLMLVGSYFIDNKIGQVTEGNSLPYKLMRLGNSLYRPLAKLRMQQGWDRFFLEYYAYTLFTRCVQYSGRLLPP